MASLPAPMSSGRLIEVSGVARDSWAAGQAGAQRGGQAAGPGQCVDGQAEQGPGQPPPSGPVQRPLVGTGERVGGARPSAAQSIVGR